MENKNQITREAKTATLHYIRLQVIKGLLEDPEKKLKDGSMTQEQVNELAGVMGDFLRKCGSYVCITTPQDVIDQADNDFNDFFDQDGRKGFTLPELEQMRIGEKEAIEICQRLENHRHLCEVNGSVFQDLMVEVTEKKYEQIKKNRKNK